MTHTLLRYVASIGVGLALALSFLGMTQIAHAQFDANDPSTILDDDFRANTGLGDTDLQETIGGLINAVLGFLGIIAVIIVLFAGFKWMTAGGNDEKVQEAKKLLISGVIGLAIIFSAWAIAQFVVGAIIGATN